MHGTSGISDICYSEKIADSEKLTGIGKIVGANGDGIDFRFWGKQSILDGSFSGKANITPGTGTEKFKGCTGSFDTLGGFHMDGIGLWLKAQGSLVFK